LTVLAQGSGSLSPEELYSKACFSDVLTATTGDASRRLLRAHTYICLQRHYDALSELSPSAIGADSAATLALRFHCYAALMDWKACEKLNQQLSSELLQKDSDRAEVAVARGYEAFYRGDAADMRSALLAITTAAGPKYHAWRLFLLSLSACLEKRHGEQARYLEQMVRFVEETPAASDMGLLANAALTLADLSCETPWVNTFEFAVSLAGRVVWNQDLAHHKIWTERALARAYAARGSHRKAQRILHACLDAAPSPQWRAAIYGELACIVKTIHAGEVADALIEHAVDYALSISWESSGDERSGLLTLVELVGDHDPTASLALLNVYDAIQSGVLRSFVPAYDRRLKAIEQHARGSAMAAIGCRLEAASLLQESFMAFRTLGHSRRAAASALRLHALTGDRKWIKRAAEAIADSPDSPTTAEIRRRESGYSDPRFSSLTSAQRRAFQLVCEGMTDAEIANALRIKITTARNHVAAVREVFGAHSRAQVVAIARASGLLSS
jgi:DNA-binding CsgD family transcriptional regulator